MMSWRKEISVSDVSVEEGQKDCICKIINWNTNWIYNVMTVQYVAGKWRVWRGVHEINDESIFRWFGYIERMETKTSKRIKGIREGLRKRFNLKKCTDSVVALKKKTVNEGECGMKPRILRNSTVGCSSYMKPLYMRGGREVLCGRQYNLMRHRKDILINFYLSCPECLFHDINAHRPYINGKRCRRSQIWSTSGADTKTFSVVGDLLTTSVSQRAVKKAAAPYS